MCQLLRCYLKMCSCHRRSLLLSSWTWKIQRIRKLFLPSWDAHTADSVIHCYLLLIVNGPWYIKENLCQWCSWWINIRKKIHLDNRLEPCNERSRSSLCGLFSLNSCNSCYVGISLLRVFVSAWSEYVLRHNGSNQSWIATWCTFFLMSINKSNKQWMPTFFQGYSSIALLFF